METALAIALIFILNRRSTDTTTSSTCCQGCQRVPDITWAGTGEIRTHRKDNISACRIVTSSQPERLPDDSFETISMHCPSNFAMHAYPQPAVLCCIRATNQGETFPVQPPPLAVNFVKLPGFAEQGAFQKPMSGQNYADNLLRPFARRARITARPALVLILSRNPWVRLRFKLLG